MSMMLKKILAFSCEICLLCRYGRSHPQSLLGRLLAWHGRWCPAWKAHQAEYPEKGANQKR